MKAAYSLSELATYLGLTYRAARKALEAKNITIHLPKKGAKANIFLADLRANFPELADSIKEAENMNEPYLFNQRNHIS